MSDPKNNPNKKVDMVDWMISVEQRLSKHDAYFKILGVIGAASLTGIITILIVLLERI